MATPIIKSTATHAVKGSKKISIHGQSGSGKTALAATCAPFKPLVIITERTGEETLQKANIIKMFGPDRGDILYDVDFIEAYTSEDFQEAIKFANKSKTHDIIILDSGSKASRLILKEAKGNYADGRKAYGEHNDVVLDLIEELMVSKKHVIVIAHTSRQEDSDSGEILYFPSFEGKAFAEKFVYEMAHVLFLGLEDDDEGEPYRALRTRQQDTNKRCKTRGGRLEDIEEPHLGRLLQKLMGVPAAERIARPAPKETPIKKKVVKKKP